MRGHYTEAEEKGQFRIKNGDNSREPPLAKNAKSAKKWPDGRELLGELGVLGENGIRGPFPKLA